MENLNSEQIKKALECCASPTQMCKDCPMPEEVKDDCRCMETISRNALALIKSQEQRIKELTAKVAKWEDECDLRGDMWCKLNEENKRLTEENEAWQKQLIITEEKSGKAYYELACEVENLRSENENLHKSCTDLTRKCASLTEENERLIVTLKMNDAPFSEGLQIVHDFCEKGKRKAEADIVRKMQEMLKEILDDFYNTGEDALLDVPDLIDQIAKELTLAKEERDALPG